MHQLGFLDCHARLQRIDTAGDPLARPDGTINRERFRPLLEQPRKKTRKSAADAKGCDLILLVKAPILRSLYNLPDQALEFQIPDRSSFFPVSPACMPQAGRRTPLPSGFSASI